MGGQDVPAMRPDDDGARRALQRLHDTFVSTGTIAPGLRPLVSDSWRRSIRTGLDPELSMARLGLQGDNLTEARKLHPLAEVMPVIRRLLIDEAAEAGLLVAVSDAAGQLLWVEGDSALRAKAEAMNFVPGADWSEDSAGTNAPGTALALDRPVQILGAEHLLRQVTPWSCTAVPIHEPDTGAVLGVLDITGGAEVAAPTTLALVRATVAAAEAELRLHRLAGGSAEAGAEFTVHPRLEVLGRRHARLSYRGTSAELSLRHSEIVLLLALAPDGLTGPELAVRLSEDDQSLVTVRAELSRLRVQLAPVAVDSKPYRLPRISTDVAGALSDLREGRLRSAVARYAGPVLPTSRAPGVVEVRADLHRRLRARLLGCSDPDALLAFADTSFGRDDHVLWARALAVLPPASPRRPEVLHQLRALDRALG